LQNGIPISDKLRAELKVPIGRVIPDDQVTKDVVLPYFQKGGMTVCVGDRTTERIQGFGLSPNLEIVDSLERRKVRQAPLNDKSENRILLRAENAAGSISADSLEKIRQSLTLTKNGSKVRLEVDGEEDLLALPIIAFYPEGTVTFYGQPGVGLVVVTSKESRDRSTAILKDMRINSSSVI
jgi:GTP-dependent dephospho-CoA kinase